MRVFPRLSMNAIKDWCARYNPDAIYCGDGDFRKFGGDLIYMLEIASNDVHDFYYDRCTPLYMMADYKFYLIEDDFEIMKYNRFIDSWITDVFPRLVRDGYTESVINILEMFIDITCELQLHELQINFMEYRKTLPPRVEVLE